MFSDRGALARAVKGYEPREGQRQMAEAVASTLEAGGMLLAEAGTGTGKTLAYLVPAILSGRRVLVSTGTKNLQEQIFFKDLPVLQKALGVPFTATLMKGRGNYLCLHRWKTFQESFESFGTFGSFGSFPFEHSERTERPERSERSERHVFLPIIEAWVKTTDTGDRAELRDLPEDIGLWKEIAADADTCLGSECPDYDDCFLTRMRRRAADSDVVIVNHHLLCADASVRQSAYGEVIPSCSTLIVDEAHQLEDVATQYFGYSASAFRVDDLVRDTERLFSASRQEAPDDADAGRGCTPRQTDEIQRALARVSECSRIFFSGLALPFDSRSSLGVGRGDLELVEGSGDPEQRRGVARALQPAGGPETRVRYTAESLTDHHEEGAALVGALEELETALALSAEGQSTPAQIGTERAADADGHRAPDPVAVLDVAEGLAAVRRRAGELGNDIRFLLRAGDPDYVYYVETRRTRRSANATRPFLRASPIDVSRIVRDALFDRMRATVLTSATLAVDGSFEYVKGRLGLRQAEELRVASEFDYTTQALLYLPRRVPSPRAPSFPEAAAREVIEIVRRSHGRAFVLFTSYLIMRRVQRLVELALPYPVLVQGTAPRTELIERFRSTPNAVLLATSSFWQGVDVVGDALSCVIVDKLPFASPADPVTGARIDAIAARGGDAFADYQVPLAILALQQGLGRLIRHRTDRGVLAILDPRLRTMGYGRRFLASLPPAPVTHELGAVERFFV